MASQQSSSSPSQQELSFDDAPQPTFRLTLRQPKHKSLWKRMKEAARSLSPEIFLDWIKTERQKIDAKLEQGTPLTDEDIEFLNKSVETQLNETIENFKVQFMEIAKIEKTDPPEVMKMKREIQDGLATWLKDLFAWVIKKLKYIFEQIIEAIDWCFEKVKEFFKKLYSFIIE